MGTAGAYLVDIKVLTDAGGTNSQYSISGIQWMINNADTDWGHNSSSRGIQIGSMSFGSVSSPLNPGMRVTTEPVEKLDLSTTLPKVQILFV